MRTVCTLNLEHRHDSTDPTETQTKTHVRTWWFDARCKAVTLTTTGTQWLLLVRSSELYKPPWLDLLQCQVLLQPIAYIVTLATLHSLEYSITQLLIKIMQAPLNIANKISVAAHMLYYAIMFKLQSSHCKNFVIIAHLRHCLRVATMAACWMASALVVTKTAFIGYERATIIARKTIIVTFDLVKYGCWPWGQFGQE